MRGNHSHLIVIAMLLIALPLCLYAGNNQGITTYSEGTGQASGDPAGQSTGLNNAGAPNPINEQSPMPVTTPNPTYGSGDPFTPYSEIAPLPWVSPIPGYKVEEPAPTIPINEIAPVPQTCPPPQYGTGDPFGSINEEAPLPEPKPGEVRIKVAATGVNSCLTDWLPICCGA